MKFFFFSIVLANKIMFAVTKYGFLYTTHYVTLALDYGIDYLWLFTSMKFSIFSLIST